jgi:GTP-binding protein
MSNHSKKRNNIVSVEFITGMVGDDTIMYDGIEQIAFIGRSNVGKSSTLNALLDRKKIVKVGRTPGKTQEINFFKVTTNSNYILYAVDLPGYGFAKVSKEKRKSLHKLITWYVTHPEANILLVCLVIDAQVGFSDLDLEYLSLLKKMNRKYLILVNKRDKVNQKRIHALLTEMKVMGINAENVCIYSARTKRYVNTLQELIFTGHTTS